MGSMIKKAIIFLFFLFILNCSISKENTNYVFKLISFDGNIFALGKDPNKEYNLFSYPKLNTIFKTSFYPEPIFIDNGDIFYSNVKIKESIYGIQYDSIGIYNGKSEKIEALLGKVVEHNDSSVIIETKNNDKTELISFNPKNHKRKIIVNKYGFFSTSKKDYIINNRNDSLFFYNYYLEFLKKESIKNFLIDKKRIYNINYNNHGYLEIDGTVTKIKHSDSQRLGFIRKINTKYLFIKDDGNSLKLIDQDLNYLETYYGDKKSELNICVKQNGKIGFCPQVRYWILENGDSAKVVEQIFNGNKYVCDLLEYDRKYIITNGKTKQYSLDYPQRLFKVANAVRKYKNIPIFALNDSQNTYLFNASLNEVYNFKGKLIDLIFSEKEMKIVILAKQGKNSTFFEYKVKL